MRLLVPWTMLACLLLAGCSSSGGGDDEGEPVPPPDSSAYAVVVTGMPVAPLEAGATFLVNVSISGAATRVSDHIGAHFGNNSTTAPSTTVYSHACTHVQGNLPGNYTITCAAPQQPGLYYFRGHARITDAASNTTVNWWSQEHTFTVAPLQN